MKKGNKYGTHRVISPEGVLPQPADKLDNNMDEIYDNEILIDVQTLNIDSASFTQIEEQAGGDKAKIAEICWELSRNRENTVIRLPVPAVCCSGQWKKSGMPCWERRI